MKAVATEWVWQRRKPNRVWQQATHPLPSFWTIWLNLTISSSLLSRVSYQVNTARKAIAAETGGNVFDQNG